MPRTLEPALHMIALCAALLLAAPGAQALPAGVRPLPLLPGAILARRECIAWERDESGIMRCVRWEECGPNVC
ncbi:MAG: hypothetical protein JO000_13215 [Alphaproteobacteria bacterium]|nr:hypothetical protein [Alphaproteobacteria bacterium]